MSADIPDRLRALARDHLEGRSSLETYRRLRSQLLDGLVAPTGTAPSDTTQPRVTTQLGGVTQPRVATQVGEPTQPRAPTRIGELTQPREPTRIGGVTQPREPAPRAPGMRSGPQPSGKGTGGGRIAGYATLGLLIAAGAAFFLWRHHPRSLAPPRPAAARTRSGTGSLAAPIRALLEPMLENPDWSDARLVALNESLLEAGPSRIDAARNTDWFGAFVDSVRSELQERQALAGAPLTPDTSPLAALAVTLGIHLAPPMRPAQAVSDRAQRSARHGQSPTRPAAQPAARAPQRTEEEAHAARGATGAGKRPVGTSVSSAAPAGAPLSRATVASAGPRSSQSANPGPAGVTTRSPAGSGATSAHREYPVCSDALSQDRLNYCRDFIAPGVPGPLLAVIPHGSFMMGDDKWPDEGPAHRVTIPYDFAMSVHEVSQAQFRLYCRMAGKTCPHQPWRGDYPVVNVSWYDARSYARWLSRVTHARYRLPTEAEWEYAARAGQTGLYPSGTSLSPTDAYFSMERTLTAPAPRSMRFNANAWHLMLMVGDVREWVEDAWSPTYSGAPVDGSARQQGEPGIKVVRGGCYADQAVRLRLTTREPLPARAHDRCTGIRLVREIGPP